MPADSNPRMGRRIGYRALVLLLGWLILFGFVVSAFGADPPKPNTPLFSLSVDSAKAPGDVSVVIEIFLLLTVLSIAPALLIMMTSFTRFIIVLSLLRQALGTQQMPPNQVMIGIALFLTFFVMSPVWNTINEQALQPYLNKSISPEKAIEAAAVPIRAFMMKQIRESDLALFVSASGEARPKSPEEVPFLVVVPAFIISELKTAFQIGFMLYIPFLILDMVISSILLSMGMMMLPPIMISLPFKLMLFVLVDGWNLIAGSMIRSFG
ncbi:MAG: flagellar type III secretion system pore protein FliP [Thermodesulfobacteriota bacterium]